jgi:hypothetical protein
VAQVQIAYIARWFATNRAAAVPVFDSVVAVLDRLIEPSPVTSPKPAQEEEREATAADPTEAGARLSAFSQTTLPAPLARAVRAWINADTRGDSIHSPPDRRVVGPASTARGRGAG